MSDEKTTVIGIDLGTTYSCLAYIDETGNPVVVKNSEGSNTTPSVVHFDPDDPSKYDVGQPAKDNALIDPDYTASFVKRIIGDNPVAITVDGENYSPEQISAYVLKKLTFDASQNMPMGYDGCVITVPAYFGDAETQATLAAAKIAGLNVYGTVQEPVAAAINYGCDKSDKDEDVIVYDLGGGTFDVSAVSFSHGDGSKNIEVICNQGDKNLGGGDWDAAIVAYLKDEFCEQAGADEDVFDEYADQQLQGKAEELKFALTSKDSANAVLNFTGRPQKISLTIDDFNDMTSDLLSRTIDIMRTCLDGAKAKGHNPTKILLVGGSTRMRQVADRLKQEFPELDQAINDPDEAVAKGAARYAAQLASMLYHKAEQEGTSEETVEVVDQQTQEVKQQQNVGANNLAMTFVNPEDAASAIKISVVTSKSYGVEVMADSGATYICNLILKNQKIDSEKGVFENTRRFGTFEAGQTSVLVQVYENDAEQEEVEKDREPLASASIDLSGTNLPKGSPIDVTFVLSEQGILDVRAVEPTSGQSCEVEVEVKGGLTEDEIREARSKATAMQMVL